MGRKLITLSECMSVSTEQLSKRVKIDTVDIILQDQILRRLLLRGDQAKTNQHFNKRRHIFQVHVGR